jgi:hypothetical protein
MHKSNTYREIYIQGDGVRWVRLYKDMHFINVFQTKVNEHIINLNLNELDMLHETFMITKQFPCITETLSQCKRSLITSRLTHCRPLNSKDIQQS